MHDGRTALVVDPGDAGPVEEALARLRLALGTILVTHHHPDHVGGVSALRERHGARVLGPARESIPQPFEPVRGGETLEVLGLRWRVIDVPGHTAGHIAYWAEAGPDDPILFCGDTLFSGGCGRLFEGTPAQMLSSLDALADLPGNTRVCCAHEYTLSNLAFAVAADPDNAELVAWRARCTELRARQEPTLPSRIQTEREINPFLRSRTPGVRRSLQAQGLTEGDDAAAFGALREWKNRFR